MSWKPNTLQRFVLLAYSAIVVLMFFFPPFKVAIGRGTYAVAGYYFVFEPPRRNASVDVEMLALQIVATTLAAAAALFATRSN